MPIRPDAALAARLAEREAFEADWGRSRKGNLSREWDHLILTVFRKLLPPTTFWWSIAAACRRRAFSSDGYETEEDAIGGLAGELGVGL